MPKIKIHRGTHQIGGTVTEITTNTTKIFIDFGSELSVEPEKSTDKDMTELIKRSDCKGILFSHYHGDHIGLLSEVPENIPVYMGKTARLVLLNIRRNLLQVSEKRSGENTETVEKLRKEYNILRDDKRVKVFQDGESFKIGDIVITPIMTDHSAFDAYMFLVKADGKTILHTGDFRIHGRIGRIFLEKIEQVLRKTSIDVLIIEGTMMSRLEEEVKTEDEMMLETIGCLAKPENKYAFLLCSSTNMDSLASFCYAAHKLGRPFLVNRYVYEQIELFRRDGSDIHRIYYFPRTYEIGLNLQTRLPNGQTQEEYMREHGFLMLVGERPYYETLMKRFAKENPLLIYSMWKGYLDKERPLCYNKRLADMIKEWRTEYFHTSGHADAETIGRFIQMVNPKEAIIPIHTEQKYQFGKLKLGENTNKIRYLEDGEQVFLL